MQELINDIDESDAEMEIKLWKVVGCFILRIDLTWFSGSSESTTTKRIQNRGSSRTHDSNNSTTWRKSTYKYWHDLLHDMIIYSLPKIILNCCPWLFSPIELMRSSLCFDLQSNRGRRVPPRHRQNLGITAAAMTEFASKQYWQATINRLDVLANNEIGNADLKKKSNSIGWFHQLL